MLAQPAIQTRAQCRVRGRQKEGKLLQRLRKLRPRLTHVRAVLVQKLLGREERNATAAEQMGERLDPQVAGQGHIGDHQVDPAHGQLGHQRRQLALGALQARRRLQAQCRLEHVVRDQLGHRIDEPDLQQGRTGRLLAAAQGVFHLLAQGEDLVGVLHHHAAGFRGLHVAADLLQQGPAQALLQQVDLAAQRLRREVELFTGPQDAA